MDLFITQNSNYFVYRHFKCIFEKNDTHIIYVRERGRGLFRKYIEIIRNLGLLNTIYSGLLECAYFILFMKKKTNLTSHLIDDDNLNLFLEEKLKTKLYKRVFSIGCPCKIDADLQKKYNIKIYNLHGGIIPFQKGRFSPIKSLKRGHQYLGASLYLISDSFDEGHLISQDYFRKKNNSVIGNYNLVLKLSSRLLHSFLSNELKNIPSEILKELRNCSHLIQKK
ncbi:hypothetical protein N9E67_02420 [Amylibacter sp.]|nr:hypothetical protein [Amylibacter sp.]